jgi:hypothetical protein
MKLTFNLIDCIGEPLGSGIDMLSRESSGTKVEFSFKNGCEKLSGKFLSALQARQWVASGGLFRRKQLTQVQGDSSDGFWFS